VDDGRHRHLDQQARRLGFADLRACLQALLDDGWSIPQLAGHLATAQPAIRRAITDHHIHQPPRREQLARQRQRAAQQRAATRVAELGFENVRVYLVDRLVTQAWTLTQVRGELGAAPATLRRLLDRYQVQLLEPTRRRAAAGASPTSPTARPRARTTTTTAPPTPG
jgi:AraC-like DNA-binding protein